MRKLSMIQKDNLEKGLVLVTVEGKFYINCGDTLVGDGYHMLNDYFDNLKHRKYPKYDIAAIYKINNSYCEGFIITCPNTRCLELICDMGKVKDNLRDLSNVSYWVKF